MASRTINIPATTNLDADELTSGTVPFARLSTGTGSTQVAVGDHTHTAAAVGAAPATRTVGTALGTTGTVNLDLAALHGTIQTVTLTGNVTFTTSNRAAGREVTLVLAAGGSSRTILAADLGGGTRRDRAHPRSGPGANSIDGGIYGVAVFPTALTTAQHLALAQAAGLA